MANVIYKNLVERKVQMSKEDALTLVESLLDAYTHTNISVQDNPVRECYDKLL